MPGRIARERDAKKHLVSVLDRRKSMLTHKNQTLQKRPSIPVSHLSAY